ncbi:DUF4862 family protein [Microbacterium atlanticum]|uniref:DUF4862 family protein n=1 Tax=Microbacterium atlanticum TaxID=2782168 RepID=UPI001886CE5B|nr:DUF4862 family protein [Microbacterium atlanticum]
MIDGLVVGAYAASPAHRVWDPRAETEFFEGLAAVAGVGAIELPWLGRMHPHDDAWLEANYPINLSALITDIPHVMSRIAAHPSYGVASPDPEGRAAAIADAARLRDGIHRLNDAQARQVISAVEVHSAPRGVSASVNALTESLRLVAAWDWDGAELVIEHCDAWRDDHTPEKGFLDLHDEIAAIEASGTGVGISLNWGRSVIEGRHPDTAVAHARAAAESGLLRGFIASGVADVDTDFGFAWIDAHLPFAPSAITPLGTPGSLMTVGAITDVLTVAGPLAWTGVKVGVARDLAVRDRLAIVAESVDAVRRIRAAAL